MDYGDGPPEPCDRRVHWKVKVAKGRRARAVLAEYYRVDQGALTFRNANVGGYPTVVTVFAPGHWLEVVNADLT